MKAPKIRIASVLLVAALAIDAQAGNGSCLQKVVGIFFKSKNADVPVHRLNRRHPGGSGDAPASAADNSPSAPPVPRTIDQPIAPRSAPKRLASYDFEVAQEIELYRNGALLGVLEPRGGVIGELASNADVIAALRTNFPNLDPKALASLKWDELNPVLKNNVIAAVSKTADFAKDRAIPGFVVRRSVSYTPSQTITFRGVEYIKGKSYELDLSDLLNDRVEYLSGFRSAMDNAYGIELHFRGQGTPGDLRADIDLFLGKMLRDIKGESVALEAVSDHQHILGKIPTQYFQKMATQGYTPDEIAVAMSLYHQNVENLMIIYNARAKIAPYVKLNPNPKNPPILNFLSRDSAPEVMDYFLRVQRGESPILGYSLKKNNVGLRSSDTYSEDGTFGFEFRFLNHKIASSDAGYSDLPSAVRNHMQEQNFPIPIEDVRASLQGTTAQDVAKNSWWRQSTDEFAQAHKGSPLQPKIQKLIKALKEEAIDIAAGQNGQNWDTLYGFMFNRWDKHPLVASNPALKARIIETQKRYLESAVSYTRIRNSTFMQNNFVRFTEESGLAELFEGIMYRTGQTAPVTWIRDWKNDSIANFELSHAFCLSPAPPLKNLQLHMMY